MKVFADNIRVNYGLDRVANAIKKYKPDSVDLVPTQDEADLIVIYAVGMRRKVWYQINRLLNEGKQFAIVQICLKSTLNPNTIDWLPIWDQAKLVWSYYDLYDWVRKDGGDPKFNFMHAPLGVDSEVFKETKQKLNFVIASSGSGWMKESMGEVVTAARNVGKQVFHLGQEMDLGPNITYSNGMDDETLAKHYSQCEFVSNLRPIEGFDMTALEGLLCGARTIAFDWTNCYSWFRDFAVYIPETDRDATIANLTEVFKNGAVPVTKMEKDYVRDFFNWEKITKRFWSSL